MPCFWTSRPFQVKKSISEQSNHSKQSFQTGDVSGAPAATVLIGRFWYSIIQAFVPALAPALDTHGLDNEVSTPASRPFQLQRRQRGFFWSTCSVKRSKISFLGVTSSRLFLRQYCDHADVFLGYQSRFPSARHQFLDKPTGQLSM